MKLLLFCAGALLLVVLLGLAYLWAICRLGDINDQHGGDLQ